MKKTKTPKSEPQTITNYPHDALQRIENERIVFWNSYKKHNVLKTIVTALCFSAIVLSFIILPNIVPGNIQTSLTLLIAVGALAGTYGYSVYVKRKFDKKLKVYFASYFKLMNDYVFEQNGFSDYELQSPDKINLDDFNECKLYKDVIESGSRGLTNFKYHGIEMSIVDCAGNVKAEKRMKPVFVGKMLRAKASYEGETPIFVYIKGNEKALPPTNMDGIKGVLEDDKMVVYSDYNDWKKVLTSSVMKAINDIKTDDILVDVALSIYGGKTYVMMGYDDPLMILPLQNEFNYKPSEILKSNMTSIAKVVEALSK